MNPIVKTVLVAVTGLWVTGSVAYAMAEGLSMSKDKKFEGVKPSAPPPQHTGAEFLAAPRWSSAAVKAMSFAEVGRAAMQAEAYVRDTGAMTAEEVEHYNLFTIRPLNAEYRRRWELTL